MAADDIRTFPRGKNYANPYRNSIRQADVEVADGGLGCFPAGQFGFLHEGHSSGCLLVWVPNLHSAWQAVFSKGLEVDVKLVPRLGDGYQVASHLYVLWPSFQNLLRKVVSCSGSNMGHTYLYVLQPFFQNLSKKSAATGGPVVGQTRDMHFNAIIHLALFGTGSDSFGKHTNTCIEACA